MTNPFIETITTDDPRLRNRSFFAMGRSLTALQLQEALYELDAFRRQTGNLYQKVRALLFLYAGYRFFLVENEAVPATGHLSSAGFHHLLSRRFEQAIDTFLQAIKTGGPNAALFSAMAEGYHQLSFQMLAGQVRKAFVR